LGSALILKGTRAQVHRPLARTRGWIYRLLPVHVVDVEGRVWTYCPMARTNMREVKV
jgi:hypothetical protein